MKSLLIAAAIFFTVGTSSIMAQSKVAHIDVQALIVELPAMKKANEEIKKLSESYEKEYTTLITEYQTKGQKYQAEAATAGDIENEKRAKEIDDIQQRIQLFQQTANQDLQKKEVELTQPIVQNTLDAIKKVGKEKGYNYVLDSSMGSGVLLADDSANIMNDVKKALNVN